jgi:hypothetical protein
MVVALLPSFAVVPPATALVMLIDVNGDVLISSFLQEVMTVVAMAR